MRILNSSISMAAAYTPASRPANRDFYSFYSAGMKSGNHQGNISTGEDRRGRSFSVTITTIRTQPAQAADGNQKLRVLWLERFMERLTGKKVKVSLEEESAPVSQRANQAQANGFFESTGNIETEDGQQISFSLLYRTGQQTGNGNPAAGGGGGTPIDPLVINFDSASVGLLNEKFGFDLDGNGVEESISLLRSGSGFLALDRNGDGRIQSGLELFGPRTGNGFEELAAFDSDHNLWIDENDPIFQQLRIWTRDSSGRDNLFTLASKGIGALYLGNIPTPLELTDTAGNAAGILKSTGIFVREDGTAGTFQDMDMMA